MNEVVVKNMGAPSEHELMVFQTMAKSAVDSKLYRGVGEQAGVMMIMLAARELGIPPCQALNGGLNIIQGRVEISARMMNALIRKAGHQVKIVESTDSICTLKGKRSDTEEEQEASFSIEDAKTAGLVKPNGGWTKFPKDMCYARALSRLARQLFPDVVGIGYVEGEIRPVEPESAPKVEIEEVVHEDPKTNEENLKKLLRMFDKIDKHLVLEYVNTVKDHFGWSESECVEKFLEEKDLVTKFEAWKNKRGKE